MKKAEQYARLHLEREVSEISNSPRIEDHLELSVYEKAFIYKYSEDGYEGVNELLRKSGGKENTEFGNLLAKCLGKLPDYEGLVYRSANLGKLERKKYVAALSLSQTLIEPTFVSTSKSKLIAMEFNGNTLFRIFSKTGKAIEKIAKFGIHNPPNEREVLFRPNRPFRILEIEEDGQRTIITMEEV